MRIQHCDDTRQTSSHGMTHVNCLRRLPTEFNLLPWNFGIWEQAMMVPALGRMLGAQGVGVLP